MDGKRFWLGALAYVAITFPFAVAWHVALALIGLALGFIHAPAGAPVAEPSPS